MHEDQRRRRARAVLALTAFVFACIGGAFMLETRGIAQQVDIRLDSSRAVVELATFYGGLSLGIAGALFVCSRHVAWLEPGLFVGVAMLAGAALVRAGAMIATGTADGLLMALLLAELCGAAINAWALRTLRR